MIKLNDILNKVDVSRYNPLRTTGFVLGKPTMAVIEFTNYCNLKCIKCVQRDHLLREKGFMSLSDLDNVLSKLPDTIEFIGLNGFGESLLHPEFDKLLYLTRTKKPNAKLGFHTNGTLLTREISELVVANNICDVEVSLDTYMQPNYSQIQKSNVSFDSVVDNIKTLINLKNQAKSNLRVGLAYIIQRENIGQLSSFISMAKELRVDFVGPIKPINPLLGYARKDWKTPYEDICSEIENARITASKLNISVQLPNINNFKAGSANIDPLDGYSCAFPMTLYPIITWDGFVMPCVWIQDTKYATGNIITQDFYEIWNGKKIRNLRKQFAKNNYFDTCENCRPGFFEYEPMNLKKLDEVYSE